MVPEPDVPDAGDHLWEWFWSLDAARPSNGFGANPITYSEIEAWARLVDAEPSPDEVRVIKAMDGAMLAELAKRKD